MLPLARIPLSITGQTWCWRGGFVGGDNDDGILPDDLVTQLLLARGCAREEVETHRAPTLRHFMPDPSIFRDMDRAAARLADAVQAREAVTIYGDYDVDGATSAALLIRLLRDAGAGGGLLHPRPAAGRLWPVRRSAGAAGRSRASSLIVTVDCGAHGASRRWKWRSAGST
jgi:single-stranded-DNA-specific exonuclease